MPFPLAHPAAVLPLRRYCPQHLDFPALIIGSLSPDFGYAFGSLHVDYYSHQFLVGSFGFCLPVGLQLVLLFYITRRPLARLLPGRYRRACLPLCQRPVGAPLAIVLSLLLGSWTHLLLDGLTHPEFWLVQYFPALLTPILPMGQPRVLVCDVCYAGCTFAGVLWLAVGFLHWWEEAAGPSRFTARGWRWGSSILLAAAILKLSLASRGEQHWLGIVPAGIMALGLLVGFLLVTGGLFSQTRNEQ